MTVQKQHNHLIHIMLMQGIIWQNRTSFLDYMGGGNHSELDFEAVSTNDILTIINELMDSSAGGDDIPAFIVKKVIKTHNFG